MKQFLVVAVLLMGLALPAYAGSGLTAPDAGRETPESLMARPYIACLVEPGREECAERIRDKEAFMRMIRPVLYRECLDQPDVGRCSRLTNTRDGAMRIKIPVDLEKACRVAPERPGCSWFRQ